MIFQGFPWFFYVFPGFPGRQLWCFASPRILEIRSHLDQLLAAGRPGDGAGAVVDALMEVLRTGRAFREIWRLCPENDLSLSIYIYIDVQYFYISILYLYLQYIYVYMYIVIYRCYNVIYVIYIYDTS